MCKKLLIESAGDDISNINSITTWPKANMSCNGCTKRSVLCSVVPDSARQTTFDTVTNEANAVAKTVLSSAVNREACVVEAKTDPPMVVAKAALDATGNTSGTSDAVDVITDCPTKRASSFWQNKSIQDLERVILTSGSLQMRSVYKDRHIF